MSNISEYLQITAKVKLLAEANYVMHIYNSSRSHDGFFVSDTSRNIKSFGMP